MTMDELSLYSRLRARTNPGRLRAYVNAAFDVDDELPRFVGQAVRTSDGYLIGDFVDQDGNGHSGAFWGSAAEAERQFDAFETWMRHNDAFTAAEAADVRRRLGRVIGERSN
jgi:hypothetical protein